MYGEVCKYTAAVPSRLWHFQCSREPAGHSQHDEQGRNKLAAGAPARPAGHQSLAVLGRVGRASDVSAANNPFS